MQLPALTSSQHLRHPKVRPPIKEFLLVPPHSPPRSLAFSLCGAACAGPSTRMELYSVGPVRPASSAEHHVLSAPSGCPFVLRAPVGGPQCVCGRTDLGCFPLCRFRVLLGTCACEPPFTSLHLEALGHRTPLTSEEPPNFAMAAARHGPTGSARGLFLCIFTETRGFPFLIVTLAG